jgi:iron complex outermembrane receptor protein
MKMLLQDTYCHNFYTYIIYILRTAPKTLLTLIAILSTIYIANAQTIASGNGKITGSVVNETGKPAEFATISLLRAKDSSIVKGALANDAGLYNFDRVANGDYIIAATAMGYKKATGKVFTVSDASAVAVPALSMQPESRTLKTVTVTASKPLIERKIDRTVLNVENSILATGNNALEILERAPGVTIDKDDNISLKGKQGVTVMINDKLTYLSSTQLAAMLRSTDGSTIQSVEVITNPSSKYDASGNSGIINIKIKKNKLSGTNGSASVTGGKGRGWRDNTSLNINHKTGDWNFFGNFSRGDNDRTNYINIKRVVTQSQNKQTFFDQDNTMGNKVHYNNYRVGADYNTSKNNTLGFLVNGDYTSENNSTTGGTRIGRSFTQIDSTQTSTAKIDQTYRNFAVNLNDKWVIDTLGQEISVDLDYSKFRNNSHAMYGTRFFDNTGDEYKIPLGVRNVTPSTITINTQKVDYVKPFSKTFKMEAGAKFSSVKTDNDLRAEVDSTGTSFINDVSRSNRFIYEEKVRAAYVNLSQEFNKTSVQLGLRAEQTKSTGDLVTNKDVVKRSYLNFFPTVFINQKLGEKNELGLSYSRRIDRPNYESLNPFVYYLDQYTYNQGNPFLKPQYTNAFELNYTYNKTINVSLGYSHISDVITEIILTDTAKKATYQTDLNFASQDSYTLNINSPFTITKWWDGNVNFTAYYNGFKQKDFLGADLSNGQAAYQLKLTQNFMFAGFKSEVLFNYQSKQTYGIYHLKERYSIDIGISRSFANKKLNIKAAVSDVFYTRRNNLDSKYQSVDLQIRQRNDSRVGRVTVTYNFGNSKIKQRERKTGADEESGRVRSGG